VEERPLHEPAHVTPFSAAGSQGPLLNFCKPKNNRSAKDLRGLYLSRDYRLTRCHEPENALD
jgi:hypothetical protein